MPTVQDGRELGPMREQHQDSGAKEENGAWLNVNCLAAFLCLTLSVLSSTIYHYCTFALNIV